MTANPIPLSEPERNAIAAMIVSSPFKNLMRVVAGQMDTYRVEAINDAAKGAEQGTNRELSSKLNLDSAEACESFLAVCAEMHGIAITDKIFTVVEIKPTR